MIRTQIQMTERMAKEVRRLAEARRTSVAAVVRKALEFFLEASPEIDDDERYERALATAGSVASGRDDLSSNHDAYFTEASRP